MNISAHFNIMVLLNCIHYRSVVSKLFINSKTIFCTNSIASSSRCFGTPTLSAFAFVAKSITIFNENGIRLAPAATGSGLRRCS